MPAPKQICPSCKFENLLGHSVCLMCKGALPEEPTDPGVGITRQLDRADVRRTVKTRMFGAPAPAEAPPNPEPSAALVSDDIDMREVVGWICCEPLTPIPLVDGTQVTIGRSPDCDLVLRHRSISRLQGLIRAVGRGVSFTDKGSANGTFLNGKRTTRAELTSGDVLTFGPYEVHFQSNSDMASRNQEMDMEGTQVIEVASMTSGYLTDEGALAELLQGMEFNQKSGTLKILSGNTRGTVVIRQGRPLWAELDGKEDLEAICGMLELKEARYAFSSDLEEAQERMAVTITAVLLEASRRQDTAGQPDDDAGEEQADD
jgi:pSer/pThr/pTyr-binding forkhead associated (FHA) protein